MAGMMFMERSTRPENAVEKYQAGNNYKFRKKLRGPARVFPRYAGLFMRCRPWHICKNAGRVVKFSDAETPGTEIRK
jgi:hypothetical protein